MTSPRKRVLFVDDEPNVLAGLRRNLRGKRDLWDMVFLESPREALAALRERPFDVVVSDMRMPEMDGAALLREVREATPAAVRILLSGFSERQATVRSVSVSHRFLAKPCDTDTLVAAIERGAGLGERFSDPGLRALLGSLGELPVLPRTYGALVEALADPDVELRQVGAILERDQATTAKILQLVNSSYFGIRREIRSVTEATSFLGLSTVRALTLSAEVLREFSGADALEGYDPEAQQEHALFVGRLAPLFTSLKVEADEAGLAGLLHVLGRLVLAARLPGEYRKVLELMAREGRSSSDAETEVLGATHAAVGAYLLSLWGLPHGVVDAVALHHDPAPPVGEDEAPVTRAVQLASTLADALEGKARPGELERAMGRLDLEEIRAFEEVTAVPDTEAQGRR